MSETTSAPPGAPAHAPNAPVQQPNAPVQQGAVHSTAATAPDLSVSDAARLLRNQRRAQAQQAQAQPGIGHNSGEAATAASPTAAAPSPDAAAPASGPSVPPGDAPRGVAALEAALGLEPGVSRETPEPAPMAGLEIDGQRYTQEQLRTAVLQATDYTQKTQAIAEQGRQLQAQQQALAAVLPLIQPELEALQRRLGETPRPDPALRQTDPAAYWDQWAAWQDVQAEQQRVAQINAMQQQARDAAMAQMVDQANRELAAKWPFWGDPAQRREIQNDIINYARGEGYTDQELGTLTNARYLVTLFKASLYDKSVKGLRTTAPVQAIQSAAVRGAAPPPPAPAAVTQAQEVFDQAPNLRNAAALIGARRAGRPNGHSQW